MFIMKCFLVCFLSYFVLESNADDASFIKPCKADDDACMLSSAQAAIPFLAAGVPALGIPAADPIFIDSANLDEPNLKVTFKNNNITGASKSKISKIVRDTDKQTIKFVIETPIFITGYYVLKGKVLFVPAFGNGAYTLNTNKIKISAELTYKLIEKDGNTYWKITGFNYTYDLVEKVYIRHENLFGGDEEAAKPIRELFDVSWKEIITELGGPIIDKIITEYVNVIKKCLLSIPANKLEIV